MDDDRHIDRHGREWAEERPGLWRSADGRYVILWSPLPENRPALRNIYTLRWCEPGTAKAWPGWLGVPAGEHHSLADAQQQADNDAFARARARSNDEALDNLPALEIARFFWPVSEGTTRAALAVIRDGDRTVVRVAGMCRGEWEYEPGTYAEIDITDMVKAQG